MKKGDLVVRKIRMSAKLWYGIIISEFEDGYNVMWMVNGRHRKPLWYSFRDLKPLTLESSKDLLSKAH
jgi:hypothetical protein